MPASIGSAIWRRDGRRRHVWDLFIFATIVLCVSAGNDSEVREEAALECAVGNSQHALEKDNEFVATHVEWVVDLSHNRIQPDFEPSAASYIQAATADSSPDALVTSAPSLCDRAVLQRIEERQVPSILGGDCNSQLSSARSDDARVLSATVSNLQREKSQGISAAQVAQTSAQQAQSSAQVLQSIAQRNADDASSAASAANSSLTSISSSASSAVSVATASVTAALSSASSASAAAASAIASASMAVAMATASANSAISIASASASSLIASAQGSASAAISSAQVGASQSIAAAQASAASDVSDARATATFALQQAKETISSAALQAAATVRASQVQAITATQAAIAIVASVIGSSLISILGYFLLVRYKKRRANRKPGSPTTNGFATGDMKKGRNSMDTDRRISNPELEDHPSAQGEWKQNVSPSDFPLPGGGADNPKRLQWSFGSTAQETEQSEHTLKRTTSRKTVFVYDPDNPTSPPTFVSKLNESLSTVSPFGSFRMSKEIKTDKKFEDPKFDASAGNDELPKTQADRTGSWIGTAI